MAESSSNDAGAQITALNRAIVSLATIVIFLRCIAKARVQKVSWDDAAMLFSFVRPTLRNTWPKRFQILSEKFYTLCQCLSIVATVTARAAFVLYLLSIVQQTKTTRKVLQALLVVQSPITYVTPVTILAQCHNINAPRDFSNDTECWDPSVAMFWACINTVSDLYLAVLPTYIFWSLNLRLRVKLVLVALMSSGLVAMVASLMRIIHLPAVAVLAGQTVAAAHLTEWVPIELYLVNITASIPTATTESGQEIILVDGPTATKVGSIPLEIAITKQVDLSLSDAEVSFTLENQCLRGLCYCLLGWLSVSGYSDDPLGGFISSVMLDFHMSYDVV
ncbi:hypothetical protein BO99DRAFT_436879 [Aspergillus violaceofuscus CBS 115571]|uniref:Rhodopsin domain-containing protein n=1 Tax=Aspergillus violaceofuscus (strain CBS 115571) TaxID=1450538 RepID=A0A2V5I5N8_ASPV1|nr:hypothetical protein BO99DRAFT_436879 [Aspergillus violaceofuscus CBS 115571]